MTWPEVVFRLGVLVVVAALCGFAFWCLGRYSRPEQTGDILRALRESDEQQKWKG